MHECAVYPLSSDVGSEPIVMRIDLSSNGLADQWEIRTSSLEERGEWSWDRLPTLAETQIIRIVTGQVVVEEEASLSIGPGLVVGFAKDAALLIRGGFQVEGSAAQPVLMTSWQDPEAGGAGRGAQPGDWLGLVLDGPRDASQLSNVEIRYAGSERHKLSCLTLASASPDLSNVTLAKCQNYAISTDLASDPSVAELMLRDNQPSDGWAVRESNLESGIERTWSAIEGADGQVISRVALGQLWIKEGAALRLDKGVLLKFQENVRLRINGSFIAEGTTQEPIILTSWRDPEFGELRGAQAGDWGGVLIESARRGSRLNNAEIRFAGGGRPDGSLVLVNSSIQVSNLVIRDAHSYPVSLDIQSALSIENVLFSGYFLTNGIEIRAGTLDTPGETVWSPWLDANGQQIVRVVSGEVTVGEQATLRLEPGTVVKFIGNSGLTVRGVLLATEADLTSLHDDETGGETDAGTEGDRKWNGIRIVGTSLSRLVGTLIRYARNGLWLENATLQLENSRIEDSEEAAINADISSEPQIQSLILLGNGANGMVIRDLAFPSGSTTWSVIGSVEDQLIRVIQGRLQIGPDSELIIDAGAMIKFAPEAGLVVEGRLQAGASAGSVVTFTSFADDTVGGDTDGVVGSPRRGDWVGIVVNPNETNAELALLNVEVLYAVNGLHLTDMPNWMYQALLISESQFHGISCDATSLFAIDDPELVLLENGAETLACPTPDRENGS